MARINVDHHDKIENDLEQQGYITCCDPACGAGATLIAAAEVFKERDINYQQNVLFAGQDIDSTTALMCYIQLSLLGCSGYVVIGNTITEPMTGDPLFGENSARCWFTPMWFSDVWYYRRWARIEADKFRAALSAFDQEPNEVAQSLFEDKKPEPVKNEQETQQVFLLPEMLPTAAEIQSNNDSVPKKPQKSKRNSKVLEGQITFDFLQ